MKANFPHHYQVDIPTDENLPNLVRELTLDDTNQLLSMKCFSGLFRVLPIDDHVHIIIQAPPGVYRWFHCCHCLMNYCLVVTSLATEPQSTDRELSFNCIALGDDASHVFTVEIQGTKNISALRKAIKGEKKRSFAKLSLSGRCA